MILAAGTLWGCMGLFVNEMGTLGFTSLQTSSLRVTVAMVAMAVFVFLTDKSRFRVELKDLPILAILGIVSIFGMSLLYFYTIINTSMAVAAILLYTSPIWVILISAFVFREKITAKKLVALVCAFFGCVFVSGIGGAEGIAFAFFITGLASGLAYGLYSIFGTFVLKKYHPYTVTVYAFAFAAAASWIAANPIQIVRTAAACPNLPYALMMIAATGIVTAFAPFVLYTCGLSGTTPGKAAIMASAEPMVAALLGFFVYGQKASIPGILLILFAILLVNNFGMSKKQKI